LRGSAAPWTTSLAVGSDEDAAAQNFGIDKLPPREQPYALADEYVDLVCNYSIHGGRMRR